MPDGSIVTQAIQIFNGEGDSLGLQETNLFFAEIDEMTKGHIFLLSMNLSGLKKRILALKYMCT